MLELGDWAKKVFLSKSICPSGSSSSPGKPVSSCAEQSMLLRLSGGLSLVGSKRGERAVPQHFEPLWNFEHLQCLYYLQL
eukprot:1143174-Pelagomonas_calceolata.AAC.4